MTKVVTENHVLTKCFISFYRLFEDGPVMFNFFKELFLFLLIHFLHFVSFYERVHSMSCPAGNYMFKVNNRNKYVQC